MITPPDNQKTKEVPIRVFEKFIQAIKESDVSTEVADRLRQTLIKEKKFTEAALKKAVFGEELES